MQTGQFQLRFKTESEIISKIFEPGFTQSSTAAIFLRLSNDAVSTSLEFRNEISNGNRCRNDIMLTVWVIQYDSFSITQKGAKELCRYWRFGSVIIVLKLWYGSYMYHMIWGWSPTVDSRKRFRYTPLKRYYSHAWLNSLGPLSVKPKFQYSVTWILRLIFLCCDQILV